MKWQWTFYKYRATSLIKNNVEFIYTYQKSSVVDVYTMKY